MSNNSIQPIDRNLSGTTIPGHSRSGSDGNEGVLCIPQRSSITGASPSDCFVSYRGHSLRRGSYPSAEMQLVYSTAPADWVIVIWVHILSTFISHCWRCGYDHTIDYKIFSMLNEYFKSEHSSPAFYVMFECIMLVLV